MREYGDDLGGISTTAHPHSDPGTGDLINFSLAYGRHSEYRIYRQRGELVREQIAAVRSDKPGYDVHTGEHEVWRAENTYPGEPVFVPAPGSTDEDDGLVLSVVLDAARGCSYLLVLDGATFTELARAQAPHVIPFGFHGQFSRSAPTPTTEL